MDSNFINFTVHHDKVYGGGNFRAWMEKLNAPDIESLFDVADDFEVVTETAEIPQELRRVSVVFKTDRAVTHELVRHRPEIAYSQESQRYCAYKELLEFIKQWWWSGNQDLHMLERISGDYKSLLENYNAEKARYILPNCTATTIGVTASLPEWKHIFNLRCSKAAYPGIRNLLTPVRDKFAVEYKI
jgi:thymidylate synthase (FAD)